ncbi:hypothetical protein ACWCQG_36815, partial [Streptomyces sp. NPDC002343]
IAALDGTGDLATIEAAAAGRAAIDDLAPAERSRLVTVSADNRRLSFRHPLIGSAVVELATASERRRTHQALADVLGDQLERRAWHLGEAARGPDATVAALLEEAARRRLRRGDALGAVTALTRAAGLSPTAADESRRLAEAAYVGVDSSGEQALTAWRSLSHSTYAGSVGAAHSWCGAALEPSPAVAVPEPPTAA